MTMDEMPENSEKKDGLERFRKFYFKGIIYELRSVELQGIYVSVHLAAFVKDRDMISFVNDVDDDKRIPWPQPYEYSNDDVARIIQTLAGDTRFAAIMARYYGVTLLTVEMSPTAHPIDEDENPVMSEAIEDGPEFTLIVHGIECTAFSKMVEKKYGFSSSPIAISQYGSTGFTEVALDFHNFETDTTDPELVQHGKFILGYKTYESTKEPRDKAFSPYLIRVRLTIANARELRQYKEGLNAWDMTLFDSRMADLVYDVITSKTEAFHMLNLDIGLGSSPFANPQCIRYIYSLESGRVFNEMNSDYIEFLCLVIYQPRNTRVYHVTDRTLVYRYNKQGDEDLNELIGTLHRPAIFRAHVEPLNSYIQSTSHSLCVSAVIESNLISIWDKPVVRAGFTPQYLDMGNGLGYGNSSLTGPVETVCAYMSNGPTSYYLPIWTSKMEYSGVLGWVKADCCDMRYLPIFAQGLLDKDTLITWEIYHGGPIISGRLTAFSVRYLGFNTTGEDSPEERVVDYMGTCITGQSVARNIEVSRIPEVQHIKVPDLTETIFNYMTIIVNCTNFGMLYSRFAVPGETDISFTFRLINQWRLINRIDMVIPLKEAYDDALALLKRANELELPIYHGYHETQELIAEKERVMKEQFKEDTTVPHDRLQCETDQTLKGSVRPWWKRN